MVCPSRRKMSSLSFPVMESAGSSCTTVLSWKLRKVYKQSVDFLKHLAVANYGKVDDHLAMKGKFGGRWWLISSVDRSFTRCAWWLVTMNRSRKQGIFPVATCSGTSNVASSSGRQGEGFFTLTDSQRPVNQICSQSDHARSGWATPGSPAVLWGHSCASNCRLVGYRLLPRGLA